jgi:hypothetical protein
MARNGNNRRNPDAMTEEFLHLTEDRFGGYDNPNEAWANVIKEHQGPDHGLKKHVKDAIWAAAIKQEPGYRGKWTAKTYDEYNRRCREYKEKCRIKEEEKRAAIREGKKVVQNAQYAEVEVHEMAPTIQEAFIEEIPDDWEDLDKEPVPHQNNVRPGISVTGDTATTKFTTPHGHRVLADSRDAGDHLVRMRCLGYAIKDWKNSTGWVSSNHAAVVDVGSGASGIKKAIRAIQDIKDADKVYHHCMFPIACEADLERESLLMGHEGMINWVTGSNPCPVLKKVNVCRHHAANCTCLSLYTHRHCFAVHSHYYFNDLDWHNLFRYTNTVHTFAHVPGELGVPFPREKPEFTWHKPRDAKTTTARQRVLEVLRCMVVDRDDLLTFEPLNSNGTTYTHRDPKVDLVNGGFHMGSLVSRWAQKLGFSIPALSFGAVMKLLSTVFLAKGVISGLLSFEFKTMIKDLLKAALCYAFVALLRYAASSRLCQTPPLGAPYTVAVVDGFEYCYEAETIAHYYKYTRVPCTALRQRVVKSFRPDMKAAKELAATMLLSKKDPEVTRKIVEAKCLRDGMPLATIDDTVQQAATIAASVTQPKNEVATSSPPVVPPDLAVVAYRSALALGGLTALASTSGWYYIPTLGLNAVVTAVDFATAPELWPSIIPPSVLLTLQSATPPVALMAAWTCLVTTSSNHGSALMTTMERLSSDGRSPMDRFFGPVHPMLSMPSSTGT